MLVNDDPIAGVVFDESRVEAEISHSGTLMHDLMRVDPLLQTNASGVRDFHNGVEEEQVLRTSW